MAVCQSDEATLVCLYKHPPLDQGRQHAVQSSVACGAVEVVSHH